ncbi:V-type ATP synthase subunit D [Candidatus Omnitrophota bacterium]
MAKLRLTKGELKRQRDNLKQFQQYLPTLQLKKQQIQIEIQRTRAQLDKQLKEIEDAKISIQPWAGLFTERPKDFSGWVKPKTIIVSSANIASVDIPVFERVEFEGAEYDLFSTPLWVDNAVESIQQLVILVEHARVIKTQERLLRDELRITTQRVNLLEKVKIPESRESIRRIRIYLGDQQTNAVGRSKLAKNKIGKLQLEEATL